MKVVEKKKIVWKTKTKQLFISSFFFHHFDETFEPKNKDINHQPNRHLNSNQLSGTIPTELGSLPKLSYL